MEDIVYLEGILKDSEQSSLDSTSYYDTVYNAIKDRLTYQSYFKRSVYRLDMTEFISIPVLKRILAIVALNFPTLGYMSAFINYYKDGTDYAPYHRDSYGCDVLTISLGADRPFLTKDEKGIVTKYNLTDGSILYFTQAWNSKHKHSIPRRVGISNPRISIVLFVQDLGHTISI